MVNIKLNPENVPLKKSIWEVEIENIPFSREFFEQPELWEENTLIDTQYIRYNSERKEYLKGSSSEFDNWYSSIEVNNDLLAQLGNLFDKDINKREFYTLYPVEDTPLKPSEFITNKCELLFRVIKDEPGYRMDDHFDNRAVFGNFFINLVDNTDVSTHFSDPVNLQRTEIPELYKAPVCKNKGIFFLNNFSNLHGIVNNSSQNRYILNILVYFPSLTN